jgi:hypothetical protein
MERALRADDGKGGGRSRYHGMRACRFRKLYPFDSLAATNQNMIAE